MQTWEALKKKKEEEEGEERISTQYSKHEIDAYLFNINYNIMQIRVSKYKNLNNWFLESK